MYDDGEYPLDEEGVVPVMCATYCDAKNETRAPNSSGSPMRRPEGIWPHDVFFRIGGAEPCKATTSLVVTSDNVILDDIWAWRADHGKGVGWTSNTVDIGVIVTGRNVTAYGLFVEHYQKYEVIWRGVCTICSRPSFPRKAPVAF